MIEPEEAVAMRIVEQYKKIFDYLDYNPVDDLLNASELSEAFKNFSKIKKLIYATIYYKDWPKTNPEITDDLDYAKMIIEKYDTNSKNSINFLEFCKFMEDLWNSADMLQEE